MKMINLHIPKDPTLTLYTHWMYARNNALILTKEEGNEYWINSYQFFSTCQHAMEASLIRFVTRCGETTYIMNHFCVSRSFIEPLSLSKI